MNNHTHCPNCGEVLGNVRHICVVGRSEIDYMRHIKKLEKDIAQLKEKSEKQAGLNEQYCSMIDKYISEIDGLKKDNLFYKDKVIELRGEITALEKEVEIRYNETCSRGITICGLKEGIRNQAEIIKKLRSPKKVDLAAGRFPGIIGVTEYD